MKSFIFSFGLILICCGFSDNGIRRIVIKEYPGATVLPSKRSNEVIYEDLFDSRFIKIKLYDYRGKMYLQCYSKDSVLLEEGNYINSLALLRKQTYAIVAGGQEGRVDVTEYYEPLRNSKWLFYDSGGKLVDSAFYVRGVKSIDFPKSSINK